MAGLVAVCMRFFCFPCVDVSVFVLRLFCCLFVFYEYRVAHEVDRALSAVVDATLEQAYSRVILGKKNHKKNQQHAKPKKSKNKNTQNENDVAVGFFFVFLQTHILDLGRIFTHWTWNAFVFFVVVVFFPFFILKMLHFVFFVAGFRQKP